MTVKTVAGPHSWGRTRGASGTPQNPGSVPLHRYGTALKGRVSCSSLGLHLPCHARASGIHLDSRRATLRRGRRIRFCDGWSREKHTTAPGRDGSRSPLFRCPKPRAPSPAPREACRRSRSPRPAWPRLWPRRCDQRGWPRGRRWPPRLCPRWDRRRSCPAC